MAEIVSAHSFLPRLNGGTALKKNAELVNAIPIVGAFHRHSKRELVFTARQHSLLCRALY